MSNNLILRNLSHMTYLNYSQKLETLLFYIEKKRAKTPKQIAAKLDVSERTTLRMIRHLKDQGLKINFDKKEKVYFLEL